MGYAGKLKEKIRVQVLRRQGYSYKEILQEVHVSKDTLSRWCRDIELTDKQKHKLMENKINGQKKGSIIAAEKKKKQREESTRRILIKSIKQIGKLNKRDRFLIGVALYAAEGTKTDGQVVFSNSDPKLIKFMSDWLKEICLVKAYKMRGRLWIHENRDEARAKLYWSKLTGIPLAQFYKSYISENKVNSKKVRKQIHVYGIFGLSCSDSMMHRQIMGWVAGITSDYIV